MFGRRNLILLCITICMLQANCADKYTDENRPYEFGFTIDGEQHRHEKKDENGIIMGEFGFITADGVYHVTVYATDENGNFKILSMKNIRVKPYPTAKAGPERGRSLEYSSSPQLTSKPSLSEQNKKEFKELPKPGPASPAKSCSHCKLPTTTTTTTTETPYIPSNKLPPSSISQEPETPPKLNQYEVKYTQNDVSPQSYLQEGQQQQLKQGEQKQQIQPGQQQLQQGQQQGQHQQSLPSGQQQLQQGQKQKQQQGQQQQQLQPGQEQQLQGQKQKQQEGHQQQQPLQQGQQQVGQQPQEQQTRSMLPQGQQTLQPQEQHGVQGPEPQEQQARLLQQVSQEQEGIQQEGRQEQNMDQYYNAQNYPPQEIESAQNYAQPDQNNEGNYPQQSYAQGGLRSEDFTKQQQQQPQQYSNGSPQNYPQNGQNSNDNYPQPIYAQNGLGNSGTYQTGTNQGQTNPGGQAVSNYPESNIGQTQPKYLTGENNSQKLQPETNRNPKSYDDQSKQDSNALNLPANALLPQENSPPKKPQLISAQMQIVDKNTDIHHKRPGEKEGLPEGLSKDDMSQLLYTFNYTVGFHGHFEEGYKNGAKVGYYYVTGRNGVRTRVDYVADEKGFRPKITQEVLDLLSDDVPKPDTEKDPKYGLKGYEFKWLYYPVDTK